MSSHHTVKFFETHYSQQLAARQRKAIRSQMRDLERQDKELQWQEYRRNLAAFKFWYYSSSVSLLLGGLLTVLAGVVYVMRSL